MQPASSVQAQCDESLPRGESARDIETSEVTAVDPALNARAFPLVTAFAIGDGIVRWWCGPCRCWHEHGQVFEAGEHRSSHCWNPRSPLYRGGYYIDLVAATPEVLRAIERGKPLKPEGRA